MHSLPILSAATKPHPHPRHTDTKNQQTRPGRPCLIGVEEVETMSMLTIEEEVLWGTMSQLDTIRITQINIPSMDSCNIKRCSSSARAIHM